MEEEQWKDIKDFEGLYQVSNFGNIKSLNYNRTKKEKLLKLGIGKDGYNKICLSKNNEKFSKRVHQLVAVVFLNHIPNLDGFIVDHIDDNPLNNKLENLQLITSRENARKTQKNSYSSQYKGVCWDKSSKKWRSEILINNKSEFLGLFNSELEASKYYQLALKSFQEGKEIIKVRHIYSSKYKQVSLHKKTRKWITYIKIGNKRKHLGYFNSEEEAFNYQQEYLKKYQI